jgi:hypothetical protein
MSLPVYPFAMATLERIAVIAAGGALGGLVGINYGFGFPAILTGSLGAGLGAGVAGTVSDALAQGRSVEIGVESKVLMYSAAAMAVLLLAGPSIPGLNQLGGMSLSAAQGAVAGAAAALLS